MTVAGFSPLLPRPTGISGVGLVAGGGGGGGVLGGSRGVLRGDNTLGLVNHATTGANDTSTLFHEKVPVQVVGGQQTPQPTASTPRSTDQSLQQQQLWKHDSVYVQLALRTNAQTRQQVLFIQLTDETDPFFLFQLSLTEEDFTVIRAEQQLLVDFQSFPYKMIELLQECVQCRDQEEPRFLARLIASTGGDAPAVLTIIETNSFKHISHLALAVVPGNTKHVQAYLADLVRLYKSEASTLKTTLHATQQELSARLKAAEDHAANLQKDATTSRQQLEEQLATARVSAAEQTAEVRERVTRDMQGLREASDKERLAMEQRHSEQSREWQTKYTQLETTHQANLAKLYSLEATHTAQAQRLHIAESESQQLRADMAELRQSHGMLDKTTFEREKECQQLRLRIAALEQQVTDKADLQANTQALLASETAQKVRLSEDVEARQQQQQRLETSFEQATAEIAKGNEIIAKLQNELRAAKAKLKARASQVTAADRLTQERTQHLETMRQEHAEQQRQGRVLEERVEALEGQLKAREDALTEAQQTIETNQHVIDYLHKQLNQDVTATSQSTVLDTSGATTVSTGAAYKVWAEKRRAAAATASTSAASATAAYRTHTNAASSLPHAVASRGIRPAASPHHAAPRPVAPTASDATPHPAATTRVSIQPTPLPATAPAPGAALASATRYPPPMASRLATTMAAKTQPTPPAATPSSYFG